MPEPTPEEWEPTQDEWKEYSKTRLRDKLYGEKEKNFAKKKYSDWYYKWFYGEEKYPPIEGKATVIDNSDGYTTLREAQDLRMKWSEICDKDKDKNSTGNFIEENAHLGSRKFLGCECNPGYKWNTGTEKCVEETTGGKTRKYKKLKKTKPKSTKKAKKSSKRRQTKKRSSHK
jgi:hypothetical protein